VILERKCEFTLEECSKIISGLSVSLILGLCGEINKRPEDDRYPFESREQRESEAVNTAVCVLSSSSFSPTVLHRACLPQPTEAALDTGL
jgi:hypothetical protein